MRNRIFKTWLTVLFVPIILVTNAQTNNLITNNGLEDKLDESESWNFAEWDNNSMQKQLLPLGLKDKELHGNDLLTFKQVQIFDASGKIVYSFTSDAIYLIILEKIFSNLPSGNYYLQILTDKQRILYKLIKN